MHRLHPADRLGGRPLRVGGAVVVEMDREPIGQGECPPVDQAVDPAPARVFADGADDEFAPHGGRHLSQQGRVGVEVEARLAPRLHVPLVPQFEQRRRRQRTHRRRGVAGKVREAPARGARRRGIRIRDLRRLAAEDQQRTAASSRDLRLERPQHLRQAVLRRAFLRARGDEVAPGDVVAKAVEPDLPDLVEGDRRFVAADYPALAHALMRGDPEEEARIERDARRFCASAGHRSEQRDRQGRGPERASDERERRSNGHDGTSPARGRCRWSSVGRTRRARRPSKCPSSQRRRRTSTTA